MESNKSIPRCQIFLPRCEWEAKKNPAGDDRTSPESNFRNAISKGKNAQGDYVIELFVVRTSDAV
jgi:hypothetical protein